MVLLWARIKKNHCTFFSPGACEHLLLFHLTLENCTLKLPIADGWTVQFWRLDSEKQLAKNCETQMRVWHMWSIPHVTSRMTLFRVIFTRIIMEFNWRYLCKSLTSVCPYFSRELISVSVLSTYCFATCEVQQILVDINLFVALIHSHDFCLCFVVLKTKIITTMAPPIFGSMEVNR